MKIAATLTAVLLAAATLGAQQTPPPPTTPPASTLPTRPVAPLAAPRPLSIPVPDIAPWPDVDWGSSMNDLQLRANDMRLQAMDMAAQARDQALAATLDLPRIRWDAEEAAQKALSNLDMEHMSDLASSDAMDALAQARIGLQSAQWGLGAMRDDFARSPRAAWAHDDPADSLYQLARQAFNDGDWRHASELFHEVVARYPRSVYAPDCVYYEAFSRYRIGSTEELHNALTLLTTSTTSASRSSRQSDVAALTARIRGALAARGDQQAAAQIAKAAQQPSGCDREDLSVRAEALNSLAQMDPAAAMPLLQQVLQSTDTCSAPLKRSALFMLVRRGDSVSTNTLVRVATNDAEDPDLRSMAISYLGRVDDPAALAALEQLVKTSTDTRVQRAAVEGLSRNDSPRARQMVRALIERTDVSESLRAAAISSLASGDQASAEDAAYLRTAYARMPSERLKEAVLRSVARMGGADNQKFLLAVAGNAAESSEVRGTAISYAGRDSTVSVAELSRLYDASESRNLRQQIIGVLGRRTDAQATDKLMDIVRTSTDPYARRQALSYLSRRKDDPRVKKFLVALVGG
jgi:HEAT repeat protein/TolA-binding protein